MKNKVMWEKWIDPFLSNLDEVELPEIEDADDGGYKDSFQQAEIASRRPPKRGYSGPIMVGPMGVIPLNEHNTPSKVYCFWMGHTNFNITPVIAKKIAEVPGVEALDVFTRYRFRIAIGKAFLDEKDDPFGRKVLDAVSAKVCSNPEPKIDVPSKEFTLNALKTFLKGKYKYWAIYGMPDGEYKVEHAESKEEVTKNMAKSNQKVVATSWE